MFAPPPVSLYSPVAASNSKDPVLGVVPRSPLRSKEFWVWACARAASKRNETAGESACPIRHRITGYSSYGDHISGHCSEVDLHRDLHRPVSAGRSDHAERSRRVHRQTRSAPGRMVEEVECLGADLRVQPFPKPEMLEEREVHVHGAGCAKIRREPRRIPEGPVADHREYGRIEVRI